MESAFRGTIYEPYDFLTDHTHALVIHANPSVLESGALSGKKRSRVEMDTLSRAAADMLRIHLPAEIHMQTIPVEGFLSLALGFSLDSPTPQDEDCLIDSMVIQLETALAHIRTELQLQLCLSVSALHINTQNVFDAYQEAFSIADHAPFLQNTGQIILFRDFQDGLSPAKAERKQALEKQWSALMDAGNYPDAEAVLLQIVSLRASAPLTVTSLTRELISRLEYAAYQLCDVTELPPGGQELLLREIDLIHSAKTMAELQGQIHRIYAVMTGFQNSSAQHQDLSWARKISAFVQNSYADPNLNADRISRRFGLHPAYISHIFHQSTGMKLLDFIHTTRIEHIKHLLRDTDMSLADIAQKTGYYDRYSMGRVFRRYVGIPPSQYRADHTR